MVCVVDRQVATRLGLGVGRNLHPRIAYRLHPIHDAVQTLLIVAHSHQSDPARRHQPRRGSETVARGASKLPHVADISGLIVGGIGSISGVVALIYAHIANTNAKQSTRIAEDSRDLAVEANDLARQSNNIALSAREIAQDANDISSRAEARETEHHDVYWEGGWDTGRPGDYFLMKRGAHEARSVKATIRYGDEEQTVTRDAMIGDNQPLRFRFASALRDYQTEYSRRESIYNPVGHGVINHGVNERIEWTTPLGAPQLLNERTLHNFEMYFRYGP
jgi:hypothetical protein